MKPLLSLQPGHCVASVTHVHAPRGDTHRSTVRAIVHPAGALPASGTLQVPALLGVGEAHADVAANARPSTAKIRLHAFVTLGLETARRMPVLAGCSAAAVSAACTRSVVR